jgi:hypothetical protein
MSCTTYWTTLPSLVQISQMISEKKIEIWKVFKRKLMTIPHTYESYRTQLFGNNYK